MVVQRIPPAPVTTPRDAHRPAHLPRPPAPVPVQATIAERIQELADDYERAQFCRRYAEDSRRQYFAGRDREIAWVLRRAAAGDGRFATMTRAQMELTARWRWSHSAYGQYLLSLEKTFTGWAQMYVAFAELGVLDRQATLPGPGI